jgi:MFS-type transporter involved in bile tolerance (Atg22 family)
LEKIIIINKTFLKGFNNMSRFQLHLLLGYIFFVGAIGTIITFKLEKNKKLQLKFILMLILLITIPSALWFIFLVHLNVTESLIIMGLLLGVGLLTMAPHIIDLFSINKKNK